MYSSTIKKHNLMWSGLGNSKVKVSRGSNPRKMEWKWSGVETEVGLRVRLLLVACTTHDRTSSSTSSTFDMITMALEGNTGNIWDSTKVSCSLSIERPMNINLAFR